MVGTLLVLGVGCNGVLDNTANSSATDFSDVETLDEPSSLSLTDMGGYTTEDEDVEFGSEDFSSDDFDEDEETNDTTITGDEEEALDEASTLAADTDEESGDGELASADYDVYFVHMIWGNLELNLYNRRDSWSASKYANWDGAVRLDGLDEGEGAIVLKRKILFDRGDEILVDDDRQSVEWLSLTGPHIDGVLLKIFVLRDADPENVRLVVDTESYSVEIPMADLDRYNVIDTLNENGVGMAIAGFKGASNDCPHGFIVGKYFKRHDLPSGHVFRGKSISESGDLQGHMRGHFGQNDDGDQVFFGKHINQTGKFQGRLFGTYDDGAFEGMWYDQNDFDVGEISGKYVVGDEVNSGFFQGLWSESCTL